MINRRQRYGIVDFNEGNSEDNETVYYCSHCEKYGFKVRLTNRIYPDGEPIPQDSSNWLQCMECGNIVPIYELEKEASIKNLVETADNPFDVAKNEFLGIDSRTSIGDKNARKKR